MLLSSSSLLHSYSAACFHISSSSDIAQPYIWNWSYNNQLNNYHIQYIQYKQNISVKPHCPSLPSVCTVCVCVGACMRACVRVCIFCIIMLNTCWYILFSFFFLDNIFHLNVDDVCMFVQHFEPQGRHFTNFYYYLYNAGRPSACANGHFSRTCTDGCSKKNMQSSSASSQKSGLDLGNTVKSRQGRIGQMWACLA